MCAHDYAKEFLLVMFFMWQWKYLSIDRTLSDVDISTLSAEAASKDILNVRGFHVGLHMYRVSDLKDE